MDDLGIILERRESDESEGDLLGRLHQGDPEAGARLYDRHHRGLYAYARSLVRDSASAEDVVHETFLRLLEAEPRKPIGSFRAFLYRIARNLALDLLRERARRSKPATGRAVTPEVQDQHRREALARAALEDLPEEQRETVILKIFGGLTFAHIGEVMSVPTGTAASRYRYALEKLADVLREE
jgi:RNA polymerase sigma-70 factor (ECF subfamily)